MIKKAALIVCTFGVLVGAHLAYSQAFVLIAQRLAATDVDVVPFPEYESESSVRSKQLALDNFGPENWTTKDVKLKYYDQSRGSYMYAQTYELRNSGKEMVVTPFAMVSVSKDGRNIKTATSRQAIITFNQPYGLLKKSAEPQRVIHAELIGDVRIRDDKGTHDNPKDDLLIGPMTGVEYDEKSMQITSKSDILIQDQDMTITGSEMMIQLRRKAPTLPGASITAVTPAAGGSSSGFEAETIFLYKNVDIVIKNVGPGGILPGQSKPDAQGQVPLHLVSLGTMRVDMPQPQPAPPVGPPNPYADPDPTYARFEKNVRVTRGAFSPCDQLDSQMLNLTLKPDRKVRKSAAAVKEEAARLAANTNGATGEVTGSPMTALKLRTAFAQGPEVWIQSESQGLKAKCVELKYDKKLEEGLPDKTYLNGGSKKKLWVEKVDLATDGPDAGKIKAVNRLVSIDAEILDYGFGVSRIVARGPGMSEQRPSRNESVAMVAWFEDQMMLVTTRDGIKLTPSDPKPDPKLPLAPLQRVLTLTGPSKLMDVKAASTLDAKERIVAWFEAGPRPPGVMTGDGPLEIKSLEATDNVHLTTPGKTLTAWKRLNAHFLQPVPAPVAVLAAAPGGGATPINLATPIPATPDAESLLAESRPEPPPTPVEGAVDGRANFVHATIQLGKGKEMKSEVKDAKLRGGVMVHQDPVAGERYGKDASGEALDLFSQGKGLMKFAVAAEEPQAANPDPKTRMMSGGDPSRPRLATQTRPIGQRLLAKVEFDGKVIESERLISLDQAANFVKALGHGSFVQLADQSLLDDKGLDSDKKNPKKTNGPGVRERLTITWNEEMRFYGRSRDKQGREVAKFEFRGRSEEVQTPDGRRDFRRGVEAIMTDSATYADTMDVYMDKPIDLVKATKAPPGTRPAGTAPTPAEPQAEIAMVEWWGDDLIEKDLLAYAGVDITSRKFFENSRVLKDKYRIRHTHVIYDKRTGDFEASGPGSVYLYKGALPKPTLVRNVSAAPGKPAEPAAPTVKLTKIQFTEIMRGRFGISREGGDPETRTGEFAGNVQTGDAVVRSSNSDLDFDTLDQRPDGVFLTSDILRVRLEPPPRSTTTPPRSPKPEDRQLLFASGNAVARTADRLIQGDRITYDSATELMYAYGDNGKEVLMTQQTSPGQPPSTINRGSSFRYNKATKQGEIIDPSSIQITDLKSGIRPKALYPDLGGSGPKIDPKKPVRMKFQRPARNATERNGFTGH